MKLINIKRNAVIILTFCSVVFACTSHKEGSIKKFVYLRARTNLINDSLGNPHLSLEEYLEYSINEKIKVAKGYVLANNEPYDLSDFFKYDDKDTLRKILENTLGVDSYDSIYHVTGEGSFSVFIYQTFNGEKVIVYSDNQLPSELNSLNSYIRNILSLKNLEKVDHFDVNNCVIEFEKNLFTRHRPPKVTNELDIPDPR